MNKKLKEKKSPLLLLAASYLILSGCANESSSTTQSQSVYKSEVKAYAKFVPKRQDDFAWENDKVAFRVYGPAAPLKGHASGVDAWLKKVDYSIIDKWYAEAFNKTGSYHTDTGEGYDPYHVGISRGVGGSAIWVDGKDYTAHNYKSYKILTNGPDKVVFTLEYEFETPLGLVNESKTISLPMGSNLYQVNSEFKLDGKPASLPIAIGITTHDEKATVSHNEQTGRISASETFDSMALWTGIVIEPNKVTDIKHIAKETKDESHIWLLTKSEKNGSIEYYAGFAWEAAGEITTQAQWHSYLDNFNK
ncbi:MULTISPECIES: DUF4861 family protein [unclassified Pseudoalteromonas]|uniref:DUF4861 family protein n=1 Tax=unclassified Pseudoalteromonas TaxID=194690 RepID=UPI0015FE3AA0|nr:MULTISPECIES: DUF4861 family protein [unclassified Pseudoalteromonas]MBB1379318.1 DUF4861 family protein [Pseudoalteromonas sp. SR43-2]MBB1455719.1 DUF4861 family protein [Pseudoalteromonas sp. SG43-5]|tara:strand:- start:9245 stop:10162 length:918 start_codon:yes stop_codon:yes gene_type:complete